MKRFLIACAAVALLSVGCQNPPQQNNVTIENDAPAGFDVNKLASLVKTSTNPQVLEKAINDPNNHINNLDLDKDGNIDYLKVEEPGQNQLKVVDDVSAADSVTVAKIKCLVMIAFPSCSYLNVCPCKGRRTIPCRSFCQTAVHHD